MNYLSFEHISKSYGDQVLFDDISLNINKGQKVALIARNGSGKTSLLRILANEESPEGEKARILKHPNVRIGYLKQEPVFNDEMEVLDTALDGPGEKIKAIRSYESALQSGDNERIQKQIEQIERLKAWDAEAMVREVLDRLEVGRFDQKVGTLSGGQRKRLSLARLLINEPDFLILDEPTNHLDLEMIEWLEDFLKQPNLTLLLVTHDRYFMERICDTIVELDGGKLYKYMGSYADYLEKKTAREENEAIRLDKSKKLLKTELEWVRRQPKARGTKAKSRVQKFEELRTEVSGVRAKDEMELEIAPTRLGSKIAELQYISKSYGGKPLIKDFHYKFRKRDRVGVVGPNGSGKSTFLKILTAQIKPDGGKVIIGETVQFGYYTQDGISLISGLPP
jgi:ATP-binding cassette subfamily F protein uup